MKLVLKLLHHVGVAASPSPRFTCITCAMFHMSTIKLFPLALPFPQPTKKWNATTLASWWPATFLYFLSDQKYRKLTNRMRNWFYSELKHERLWQIKKNLVHRSDFKEALDCKDLNENTSLYQYIIYIYICIYLLCNLPQSEAMFGSIIFKIPHNFQGS